MNHLHSKDSRKLKKLREEYLKYVYQTCIHTVLLTTEPSKEEKLLQALAYAAQHPKCVQKFLSTRKFPEKEQKLIRLWEQEHYDKYHILQRDEHGVRIYGELQDCLYYVVLPDTYTEAQLLSFPMEYIVTGSVYAYGDSLVLDSIIQVDMRNDGSLEEAEAFYECMLEKAAKEGVVVSKQKTIIIPVPERTENTSMDALLYDFIAPFGTVDTLKLQTLRQVLYVAAKGWNEALVPGTLDAEELDEQSENLIEFFKKRKQNHFSEAYIAIKAMQVRQEDDAIIVDLETGTLSRKEKQTV